MKWALLVVATACGSRSTPAATIEPLPASPVGSATVLAPSREPDRATVLAFCEQYRRAMESRDPSAVMALVSKRYDDAGTTYDALEPSLRRFMSTANQIRYEILWGKITTRADGAVEVEYHYSASFLTATGWTHKTSESTLVLERRGDSFAILSGM